MGPIFETKDIVIGLALAPFCICLYPLACAVVGVHECVAKVTGKRWSDRHKRVPVGVAPRRPLTPPLPSECDIDQVEDKGDVNENNTTTTANNPESARRDATNNQSKQKQKQKRKRKRKLRRILKHKRKARAHTNPHPQANSILFRLPLELRMAIYSGVLTFPFRLRIGIRGLIGREGLQTDRNYYDRPNWRAGRNKGKYGWTVFGLLCCCRRVYTESLPLLYTTNILHFTWESLPTFSPILKLPLHIIPRRLRTIRSVTFIFPMHLVGRDAGATKRAIATWQATCAVLAQMSGLRTLIVEFKAVVGLDQDVAPFLEVLRASGVRDVEDFRVILGRGCFIRSGVRGDGLRDGDTDGMGFEGVVIGGRIDWNVDRGYDTDADVDGRVEEGRRGGWRVRRAAVGEVERLRLVGF